MAEQSQPQPETAPTNLSMNDEVTQPAAAFSVAAAVEGSSGTAPPAPSVEAPAADETLGLPKDVPMTDGTEDAGVVCPL